MYITRTRRLTSFQRREWVRAVSCADARVPVVAQPEVALWAAALQVARVGVDFRRVARGYVTVEATVLHKFLEGECGIS